jgi:hypothetical protein
MTVTVKDKTAVIDRDGGFCLLTLPNCLGEAQTADHRANRGQGGAGSVLDGGENLIAACSICNNDKENATGIVRLDLIERGLRVVSDSTHRKTLARVQATPVQALDGEWWMLLTTRDRRRATAREIDRHLWSVTS